MNLDITAGWFNFAADCNRDPGYANSHQAGLDRSELEEAWRRECPGLEFPQVLFSNESGCYELHLLSVPRLP